MEIMRNLPRAAGDKGCISVLSIGSGAGKAKRKQYMSLGLIENEHSFLLVCIKWLLVYLSYDKLGALCRVVK
jgi:hypothetical protein